MSQGTAGGGTLPEEWRVRLPVFEGPLDLLLHLVRINEVDIYDIPVALICDQFHEYLGLMEELNLDVAADYVYTAALLIHLKSRMLLPRHQNEEGVPEEDPRQELVARLVEYRRLKEASQSLAELHGLRLGVWTRRPQRLPSAAPDEGEGEELDLGDISLYDLLKALREALGRYEREHPEPLHLRRESFSVREQFDRLLGSLSPDRPLDLLADLRSRSGRSEVVASFLAVLELTRLGLVRLHQTKGGEILLFRTERPVEERELESVDA
jgi:segregation and condensation protein A